MHLPAKMAMAALAVALATGAAAAQQAPVPPASVGAKPNKSETSTQDKVDQTWDETKAMTRKQWNAAKKKWASEKVKWRDCNRQADTRKLEAPKSWSFVANCMTKT